MKLRDILLKSEELDENDVVFAMKPWSLETEAKVVSFAPGDFVPRFLQDDLFEYFLEAPLIADIRSQITDEGGDPEEVLRILLYYAENDAFLQR